MYLLLFADTVHQAFVYFVAQYKIITAEKEEVFKFVILELHGNSIWLLLGQISLIVIVIIMIL